MGLLGLIDNNNNTNEFISTSFLNKNEFLWASLNISETPKSYLQYSLDCFLHGVDWIYTFTESLYAYEYKILYLNFLDSIFDDSFDIYFNSLWYFSLSISTFQLFWAFFLDNYILNNIIKLHFNTNWYKAYSQSLDFGLVYINHPELTFIDSASFNDFYLNYSTDLYISIYNEQNYENVSGSIVYFPELLLIMYVMVLFIIFFFSHYNNYTTEENTIDSDFLLTSSIVESEKELGSLDDMLFGILVVSYIFGWYFYIHAWSILSIFPEIVLVFYLFPVLYYIILAVPTFLSYDFGIFFLAYLRGVGPSPVFIAELMYDYIAFTAFYIRLFVQGVRLVLMIFTYISMHDLILFFSYDRKFMLGNEDIWEQKAYTQSTVYFVSYFFLFQLPNIILYWMYEIFHTFFVVTAQLVAFFAMVFWLFLFLYTFFVFEKIETYFKEKREFRKNFFYNVLKFKK